MPLRLSSPKKKTFSGQRLAVLTALLFALILSLWSHQAISVAASQDVKPSAPGGTSITGTRGSASRTAVVNVAQLARQEQLAPPAKQALAVDNEFDEEEAAPHNKPVPAGANAPSDRLLLPETMTTAAAPSPAPAASLQALDDDNSRIPPDTHRPGRPNPFMGTANHPMRTQTKAGA